MKKIIEYTIVLDTEVNNYIKEGWQPLGSISIIQNRVSQAMVKYEEVIPRSEVARLDDRINQLWDSIGD